MSHDPEGAGRARRAFVWTVAVLALAFLALLNARLHRPGTLHTVRAQLRYLDRALEDGAAERMQASFPEGYVFTWALYGLASAQTARQSPPGPARMLALEAAETALDRIRSERARAPFDADLEPRHGAFYRAWTLYLFGEYVRAAGAASLSPRLLASFQAECDRFAAALDASPTPFLPSYPFLAWPADSAVGVGALGICEQLLGPRYGLTIARWIDAARERLDAEVGALSHAADPVSGAPREGVRGSSLALMSRALVDADSAFAREQYRVLRARFFDRAWGVPGFREYPLGTEGAGDVDSGPILLGFSGPAVVVGAAAARVHGDLTVADALLGVTEMVGLPVGFRGRRYAAGLLPVGDAFIAWARSSPPAGRPGDWPPLPWWWPLPIHAVSFGLAALIVLRARHLLRRGGEGRPSAPKPVSVGRAGPP